MYNKRILSFIVFSLMALGASGCSDNCASDVSVSEPAESELTEVTTEGNSTEIKEDCYEMDGDGKLAGAEEKSEISETVQDELQPDLSGETAMNKIEYEMIQNDIHDSRNKDRGYYAVNTSDGSYLYTVCSGMKTSGGYSVRIQNIFQQDNGDCIISVKENAPLPGTLVTSELTYPSCSVSLNIPPEKVKIIDSEKRSFEVLKNTNTNTR